MAQLIPHPSVTTPMSKGSRQLWSRWVLANTLGELIGLGAAAIIGVALSQAVVALTALPSSLVTAALMIALGTFEGVVVGTAQWLVLRRPLPTLTARAWLVASAAGACVAWALGMLPSTLIDAGAAPGAGMAEMSDGVMYALAAAMGAVLGPLLGAPQWLVLRRHLPKAAWWIPANVAAWALGMPVVFVGASKAPTGGLAGLAATGLLTAAAAGAVVGAIHGLVLVWLLRQKS